MATEEVRFLTEYVPREYPSVALAVDLVVFAVPAGTLNAVFVRRGLTLSRVPRPCPAGSLYPMKTPWPRHGAMRAKTVCWSKSRSRHDVGRAPPVRSNQPSRATAGPV